MGPENEQFRMYSTTISDYIHLGGPIIFTSTHIFQDTGRSYKKAIKKLFFSGGTLPVPLI